MILGAVITMGLIGLFIGIALSIASKTLQPKENPKIEKIANILPGFNCGACGSPGCKEYAKSIIETGAAIELCKNADKEKIKKILEED